MNQQSISDVHYVWINEVERIVSFHEIDGYEKRLIRGRDTYIAFLQRMQEQGYRFQ